VAPLANAPEDEEILRDALRVRVDGRTFTGWTELELDRSLEAATGSFRLQFPTDLARPIPVLPYQRVEVSFEDDLVATGYVDTLDATSSRGSRTATISGRDVTADLVDSSALEPFELAGVNLFELATRLADPFGIDVVARATNILEPFPTFRITPGEKAFAALERAARLRGVLIFTTGDGRLALEAPGIAGLAGVPLVEDPEKGNILEAKLAFSSVDRFQTYLVRGQAVGNADAFGLVASAVEGTATDPEVDRYRPLLVVAPQTVSIESAEELARWEATVRAARAARVEVQVQGVRQEPRPGSPLWRVNQRVRTRIPTLQVDAQLLVNRVRYSRSRGSGTRTTLELVRRDAYDPKPAIDPGEDPLAALFGGETVDPER